MHRNQSTFFYADHNFLIQCVQNSMWRDLITEAHRSGEITLVMSAWHFYEFGNAWQHDDTEGLLEFAEEVGPLWIIERADLQLLEYSVVWRQVWNSSKDEVTPFCTLAEAVSILNRVGVDTMQKATLRDIVRVFSDDDVLRFIHSELAKHEGVAASIRPAYLTGKITSVVESQIDARHLAVQQARLESPHALSAQVFKRADELGHTQPIATQFEWFIKWGMMMALKSYQTERGFSMDLFDMRGKLDANRYVDRQHAATCLPFVHAFVTSDRKLRNACHRVSKTLPFPTATTISGEKFISMLQDHVQNTKAPRQARGA